MTRLLINSTEQVQPKHLDSPLIKLFGRDENDDLYEVTVEGFDPHFYAPSNEVEEQENALLGQESISRIEYGDYEGMDGTALTKIVTPQPQDIRDARDFFTEHYSADVPFTNRFRVDTELRAVADFPEPPDGESEITCHWQEIKPVQPGSSGSNPRGNGPETTLQNVGPRVLTLDIEVDDRGEGFPVIGEERILSIVAHDSYEDESRAFFDTNGRDPTDCFPDGAPDNVDAIDARKNEYQMLRSFRDWFTERDPDLVSGWNSDDFDIPFILKRMDEVGLNNDTLSRLGWSGMSNRGDPRMKGRTMYDLLTVYRKNQFTNIRSYSLDDVAEEELGEKKLEFEGSYYDLYQNDPEKFLRYNARDVNLTVRINEEAGVVEFRDILRREVGVDFGDSFDNKDFVDMMCRRKLKERGVVGPSRPDYGDEPDSDYEGAFVFDAYEGVADNVVGIDLASLYPYTMAMLNASPETKVDGVTDDFTTEYVHGAGVDAEVPACVASNDQGFQLAEDGLFTELVDEAISLKSDYKRKRQRASTDEEYEKWDNKYGVAKTLTNSLYGVTGWERFFLYDEAVAEAVTLTGQTVLKRTAEYVEETGYDVIYGDTDSTYIKFPDEWDREQCLDTARELCTDLNETVYPELAESMGIPAEDNLWEIEVEAYMEKYFQAGRKKRYAYVATWKDGREIENPEPSISGFSSRRSDTSELTVETEKEIFDAILSGEEDSVGDIVYEAAKEISDGEPDWDRIGIPGGMNKKVTDDPELGDTDAYYTVSSTGDHPQAAHPRAVWNANQILGVGLNSDDKPKRVYLNEYYCEEVDRKIDVIAFAEPQEIEQCDKSFAVDVPRMTATLLTNPFTEILDAIDVDVTAAVKGQTQKGLGAWE